MRIRSILAGSAMFMLLLAAPASSQTSQISKTWELGTRAARLDAMVEQIERKDQRGADPYLQQMEDRIALAAARKPNEVRFTLGDQWYAFLLPQGAIYISGGLLQRIQTESELAGLLAHELAHGRSEQCILAGGYLPIPRSGVARESERQATRTAIGYLKSAGYDPSAQLDLLSKIAYEHQPWAKAIVAEDLLSLRVALEAESLPPGGYAVDGAEFTRFQERLSRAIGRPSSTIRIAPDLRRPADQ